MILSNSGSAKKGILTKGWVGGCLQDDVSLSLSPGTNWVLQLLIGTWLGLGLGLGNLGTKSLGPGLAYSTTSTTWTKQYLELLFFILLSFFSSNKIWIW